MGKYVRLEKAAEDTRWKIRAEEEEEALERRVQRSEKSDNDVENIKKQLVLWFFLFCSLSHC